MEIVNVQAVQPAASRAPQDWRGWLGQILVRVDTDDGLTGYGMGGGGEAGVHVVETVLRAGLLGEDPCDVEDLWAKLYRQTLPFGQKGLAIMALSGVDLALWDLRGKRENGSIVELLGGTAEEAIPAYQTTGGQGVEKAVQEGFQAVKIGGLGRLDPDAALDDIIAMIRDARQVLGPERQLMADASLGWDVAGTLQVCERISEYDLTWLEEPLPPDDLEGYHALTRQSPVPIAGGEHEYTAAAFETLAERRLHAVLQPDVCWCGGLTELVKIYELGRRYGMRVCPHRGSEVWALHAIAALDPDPLAESGRPWMTWVGGPEIAQGTIATGGEPGFGVRFDSALWE